MGDCSLASILTFIAGVIMGTGSTLTIKVCVCVCQKRGAHKGMKRANVPSQITNQCRAKNPCLPTCPLRVTLIPRLSLRSTARTDRISDQLDRA